MPKITKPRTAESALPPFDERLRYRPEIAARFLDQSRAKTFQQIRDGVLPVIREGRRTFVPGHAIAARCRVAEQFTVTATRDMSAELLQSEQPSVSPAIADPVAFPRNTNEGDSA